MPNGDGDHRRLSREDFYSLKLMERPMDGEQDVVCGRTGGMEYIQPWLAPEGIFKCPRCADTTVYTLSGGRLRCGGCKYTFTELTGRWINSGGLCAEDWVFLCRLFVEGINARRAAELAGLSYNAAFRALTAIRFSITAQAMDAPMFFSAETGLRQYIKNRRLRTIPRRAQLDTAPVIGLMETHGWVFADLMQGFQCDTLYHFHLSFNLPLKKNGNIVHSGKYRQYMTLVTCADPDIPFPAAHSRTKPEVDQTGFNFWAFARERLKSYKGITPSRFPLYLKEMEFRYNHRDKDLMPLVLEQLCAPVPDFA